MTEGATPGHGGHGGYGEPSDLSKGGTPGYGYPGQQPGGNPYAGPSGAYGSAQGAPGGGFPGAPGGGHVQPLVTIGDITVTSENVITPAGPMPLKGAVWTLTDMSRTEERIPAHAVVLAIVFAVFCLIGLLFLLMKERNTTGHVQVTVNSGGKFHATMIPVHHPMVVHQVMDQVNYARSVSV